MALLKDSDALMRAVPVIPVLVVDDVSTVKLLIEALLADVAFETVS